MSASTKVTVAVLAAAVLAAGCSDTMNTSDNALALSEAFATVPAGFSANSNSFDASGDNGLPFLPGELGRGSSSRSGGGGGGGGGDGPGKSRDHAKDHRDGFGRGIRGLLMGGGLGPDFIGAFLFGRGKGRGPFGIYHLPASCTFSATTGRVTCPETTKHGLKVNVSFAFKDAEGDAQPAFDTVTTSSVNVKATVAGTKTRRDSSTSVVSHASDRTVSGLEDGSDERTVKGTASASETSTGTRDDVKFTAVRTATDTTKDVVIPIVDGKPTIPSKGKVIRTMTISITPEDGTARAKSRREEITFNGTNVVSVKITQDGVTKDCTITLPSKKLVCN